MKEFENTQVMRFKVTKYYKSYEEFIVEADNETEACDKADNIREDMNQLVDNLYQDELTDIEKVN